MGLNRSAWACVAMILCGAGGAMAEPELRSRVAAHEGMYAHRLGDGPVFHQSSREPIDRRELVLDNGAVVVMWSEAAGAGPKESFYAISRDGVSVARAERADYSLQLRHGAFDPLVAAPAVDRALAPDVAPAGAGEESLYLVQFVTQPLGPYLDALDRLGAERAAYVPSFAYVVRMTAAEKTGVEALPFVRWVGAYHAAYRLDEASTAFANARDGAAAGTRFNILLVDKAAETKASVGGALAALGGVINNADAGARLIEATLTPAQLRAAAALPEVLFIDPWGPNEDDMDIARQISGGTYFSDTLGLNGEGVRGEVMDSGFLRTHSSFNPPPIVHGPTPDTTSHGTATYGINFATGASCSRGVMTQAVGICADYGLVGNYYTHVGELVNPALEYKAVYQSNSWGASPETTSYTTTSATMDDTVFDFDILIFRSQGNTGGNTSRAQAWAKNVIAVGGIRHRNTLSVSDDAWTNAGSIGPAADGRLKPDLAHFYDSVATTGSSSTTSCNTGFGGTSAATPITAGHSGLWFQLWHSGELGNTPGATVFESRPHFSLSKAMLIASADQWTFSGTAHDLTRTHQGWGRVSLRNIHDARTKMFWVNESEVLEPLETVEYPLLVVGGEPSLKATLCYADPPGNPSVQSQHRVNDLDLTLIAPDGTTYLGNVGLAAGMWSTAGGTRDSKNTVECIFVQNPQLGEWTLRVTATEVNQDSHVETLALDADFGLAVLGATLVTVPVCPFDVDGDLSVGLSDLAAIIDQWFTVGQPGELGDLNSDGRRDLIDLSLVIMYWGTTCD